MKCVNCGKELDDSTEFCPECGAKNAGGRKITSRAFMRIFRPSFFGGLEEISMSIKDVTKCIVYFRSFSRDIGDDEIEEVNYALDVMLNNANDQYKLYNSRERYIVDANLRPKIDDEEDRYEIVSELIEKIICKYKSSGKIGTKMVCVAWLFAMLSALDGTYSKNEKKFFGKMKRLYPISRESIEQRDDPIGTSIGTAIGMSVRITNGVLAGIFGDSTTNSEKGELKLPEDFDFYDCVEKVAEKLCEYESQIRELEDSTGKYSEIAGKTEAIAKQEGELLDNLQGFVYAQY